MFVNNNICVETNNFERTRFFKSNVGVFQGDIISPLLFKLYVSDLKEYLEVDDEYGSVCVPWNLDLYVIFFRNNIWT